jgi:hypothetical protein
MQTYEVKPIFDPADFKQRYKAAFKKALDQNPGASSIAEEIEAHPQTIQKLLACYGATTWNGCNINLIENENFTENQMAFKFFDGPSAGQPRLNGQPVQFI